MCKKNNYSFILVTIFLLSLIIIGSIFDYEISSFLYLGQLPKENLFGVLFAFVGVIPVFLGWSFLGASIIPLLKNECKKKKRWLIALSILLFILSFFYFCNTLFMVNQNAFYVHWAIAYLIGTASIIGSAFLGYKLAKSSNNPNLLNNVILLAIISLFTMAIVMISKEIMSRPRFRFVLKSKNPNYFINWWENGNLIKNSVSLNGINDEFSSFPSGHSAYAMFAIFIFPALSDYHSKYKRYKNLLFFSGFVWWILTALSRITVGAHYLTDVSIAGLLTILTYFIVLFIKRIIKKMHK